MSFGQPFFLWFLALVPLLALFLVWAQRRRQAALLRLGQAGLIAQLSATVNRRGRRWQLVLWLLALTFLVLALARPQWGSQVQVVEQEGVQIMVALDISKSMLAADLKPDRLTRAKYEISDLMNRLKGDEIGLVLFSGASFIQFPLTSDYDTARAFLTSANPNMISRPGTAIGAAIATATQGFDPHRSNQKVIVIMTDGEDHEADVEQAAQDAAAQGIIIYTIGFGSPQGEPIPEFDEAGKLTGYKKDANGAPILSKLDEVTLQRIALVTQGRYFRASAGGEELDALAGELDQLQKAQLESRFTLQKIERYQIFLTVALLALLLAESIPERLRRRDTERRPWWRMWWRMWWRTWPKPANLLLLLLCFGLMGCGESAGRLVAQGNEAFAQKEYPAAGNAYQSAQSLDPQAAVPLYNLANTYYEQGVYTNTQQLLPQALNLADATLAPAGYYNLGNSHYQTQQWKEAVEAYKETLRRHPGDQDAKHNLELAQRHLQNQQQQDQQQQDQQNQQDQQQQNQQQQPGQTPQPQSQDQPQQPNNQGQPTADPTNQDQPQQPNNQGQPTADQTNQGQQADQPQPDQTPQPQNQDQPGQQQADQGQPTPDQANQDQQTNQGSAQSQPTTTLSEAQARQLLNSIGQKTQTLQERLQGVYVAPGPPPDKDW